MDLLGRLYALLVRLHPPEQKRRFGAWTLSRFLESLLYEVRPADPITLGAAAALLLGVALAASLLPGLRTVRVDPSRAVRADRV